MTTSQPLTHDDLKSMRKTVRAQHPVLFGGYPYVMTVFLSAFLPALAFALKPADTSTISELVTCSLVMLCLFGITWAFRTKMMSATSASWASLFARHHLQTFAGEKVTVELANWSGRFATVRFADGTKVKDYRISHLCDENGERHLQDETDWDRSLANLSRIRWMVDGREGVIRGSNRESLRETPYYLIGLTDGRSVWRSFEDMLPSQNSAPVSMTAAATA
ncbi:hypothetical protein G6L37_06180 [Agrobacterium rubi]|nr:hypothetical protein [Agrobacterium rubi]NTF24949.1 hypothetical protein [Agrobacterium rubi]